jgi:hypothetical protein
MDAMKKTTKKIGLHAETLRKLAQPELRDLADHELNIVAGGTSIRDTVIHSNCLI